MQSANTIPFSQTTTIPQQPIKVKPKLSKFQNQHQNIQISIKQAPRAKSYHTIPIVTTFTTTTTTTTTTTATATTYITTTIIPSKFIQTGLQNSKIHLNQFQSTIGRKKLAGTIIQTNKTNQLNPKIRFENTFKLPPIQQGKPISQVSIPNPLSQNFQRLLSPSSSSSSSSSSLLLTTTTLSIPVTTSSVALGNIKSQSAISTEQISSNSLWFNETLPSFGTVF
ncbi:hypothetical protein LOAG_11883 [Loa loa]|uniref:Uncharacterized protein n=1 Tax=Loa loa TaxID=7209 RepID=A0A1S0TMR3_LOALO|nr:hypothetical protein LOAG_11883 [Loa loa]EFO16620.2 hypothetical protein LOAG_11883 [Loa loa]